MIVAPLPRLAAVVVSLSAVLAGCTGAPPKVDAPAPPMIRWGDCDAEVPGSSATSVVTQCGVLAVPRDWDHPGDHRTASLAVVRVRRTDRDAAQRRGVLVVQPGGPGTSGVDAAATVGASAGLAGLLDHFDVVGFDSRGIRRSEPLDCPSDALLDAAAALDPDPPTRAGLDAVLSWERSAAADCSARDGDRPALVSTTQGARDLDALRTALGERTLSYLGFSYGAVLGTVYAQLFPRSIRVMVLDSPADATMLSTATGALERAGAAQTAVDRFVAWCARSTCPLAPDPGARLTSLLARSRTAPPRGADGRAAGPGVLASAVGAGLMQGDWNGLAAALAADVHGDPAAVLHLADTASDQDGSGHYGSLARGGRAVVCADVRGRPSADTVATWQQQWRARYPLVGGIQAVGMAGCTGWPAPAHPVVASSAPLTVRALVLAGRNDPNVAYSGAERLAAYLGGARVVTWEGEGHITIRRSGCTAAAAAAYLVDLVAPPPDLICAAGR